MKEQINKFYRSQIEEIFENKLVNSWVVHLILSLIFMAITVSIVSLGNFMATKVEGIPVTTLSIFVKAMLAFFTLIIGYGAYFLVGMASIFVALFGFRWQHKLHELGIWPKAKTVKDCECGGLGAGDGFGC